MRIPQLLLLLSVSLVSATSTITAPKAGAKLVVGQPTEIKWTTDVVGGTINMNVCWNGGVNSQCNSIASGIENNGSTWWTPDSDLATRTDYYILFFPINHQESNTNSGNFAISSASASQTSTSPSSTSGSSQTSGTTDPTSSSTSPPSGDSGSSSNGGIIGGAIAAVVVVIAIAVVGFIWMRKRNQKKLAEARRGNPGDDDVETGEKTKGIGAAGAKGDKKGIEEAFAPKDETSDTSSIPMAELPAVQQEPVEMAAAPPTTGQQFFAMELDSREIPRPGSSVKPDVDPTSKPSSPAAKPSMDKGEHRGASIDGTTVNSETERPRTAGSIEQIKESSREDLTQENKPESGPRTPLQAAESERAGPSVRDSTPQIGSIPKLGGFDFDSAKF
ncbi:hypothetical protein H072_5818 [Dactylellina haptotyla CBS 200.50]|uniref:Yeast cell wall synthesis Kre9/Knh1-like N-terminal domain-containing protein n=1 Tax=Dactylellina haptotyla (strain CBS 200.50) TaxID=1284197 RepID=S8BYH9_DACHA|nr:hypothetical protein H072_5818 [Dactylellina haptotyla CBS 200.50]